MNTNNIVKELTKVSNALESAAWTDDEKKDYEKYQKNFNKFTKELEGLSKKYGISLSVIGGVNYGKIKSISYDHDLSSGDLQSKVDWAK